MDLTEYRNSATEKQRIADLLRLVPGELGSILDIGARDGFISTLLTGRCARVTALDLELPSIAHERINCVKGDITALDFADRSFDLVFCAEVLEHIPPPLLGKACSELARVASSLVLVGVPYRQDIRVGRTTCQRCGNTNPPWGHVNSFDEQRLAALFPHFDVAGQSYVGCGEGRTNRLSTLLMDIAGNPYGTYSQEEPCIHCGAHLEPPPERAFWQKLATKAAFLTRDVPRLFVRTHANWIHLLLKKRA